ncbi:MAG: hypothetical protein R3C61_09890 [Bacteroidia bacterium]
MPKIRNFAYISDQRHHSPMIESIREALAQSDLPEALKLFRTLLDNSPQLDEIIVQSGRFYNIKKQIRLGLVTHEQGSVTHAQILAGLTDLLREVETQSQKPEIREEITKVVHYHYYGEHKSPATSLLHPFCLKFLSAGKKRWKPFVRNSSPAAGCCSVVNGRGGIGKTTLASRYYHSYQADYAHTAWLLSESGIAFALLRLAHSLGIAFEDRMPIDERLDLLLAAMAELNRPASWSSTTPMRSKT